MNVDYKKPCTHSSDHSHAKGPHEQDVAYVSCVKHRYEDGTSVSLCGIDFCAHKGERTVLLGPNGAGKTTLLYHVLGLLRSEEGMVRVFGLDPATSWKKIRERIGVVLQNVDQQLIMPTVWDDIAFSACQYGWESHAIDQRVQELLALFDIDHLAHRSPHTLSGGEKRKVALAGALVTRPGLLVLDEPFEGLDQKARGVIVDLLHTLSSDEGVTIVMSTHDIDAIGDIADFCYVLKEGGEIVLSGTPAEIFDHAETMLASHIRPPILAELFSQIAAHTNSPPTRALTVSEAVLSLLNWKKE